MKKQLPGNQGKSSAKPGPRKPASSANPAGPIRKTLLRTLFAIDARSLALFRAAMGALLLVDLAVRATDLKAMYTDEGMFSRAEICRHATNIWNWSFHFGSGSVGYQAMLFGIAAVLGIALLIGFETRLVTVGSWLMLLSIHHRVPPILSGAEILQRILLFWAMFLPLERAWSVDRWREKRQGALAYDDRAAVLSVASAAILLQMGLMYFFSAIFKSNTIWFRGEALAGILAHDFYASPAGAYLLRFPALLKGMTWGTFVVEWAAAFLLFFPRYTFRVRLGIITALALMHIAIGLCLEVGLFSYVSLAGLALFLPAEFWNSRLLARFMREKQFADAHPAAVPRQRPRYSWLGQGVCAIFLIFVLAVNVNGLPSHPLTPLTPERWKPLTTGLGLGQRWGMFEAIPSKDGWYVARAKLNDGSEVDLLRQGAPVDWNKPPFPGRMYPNHFWQKLFREMAYYDAQGFQVLREPVAEFLCRDWNARHPAEKQVAEFEFVYLMENKTEGGNGSGSQISREQLVHLDLSGT